MKVKSESEVAQSCLTLSDPMDCSPLGSSVLGIFQARVLEWGAIAFSTAQPLVATILVTAFMSLTALEVIGWQFQDQVSKRLYLPSVYSLCLSHIT